MDDFTEFHQSGWRCGKRAIIFSTLHAQSERRNQGIRERQAGLGILIVWKRWMGWVTMVTEQPNPCQKDTVSRGFGGQVAE